ncbi:Cof-type HAD-IIB family hydrolase [Floccifex sp.]|uniref:Cof-type HAD-IIB family hydrolase n=1 Tax=Floccifex sp. TaxID=2815810 RepID=UPI003F0AD09D
MTKIIFFDIDGTLVKLGTIKMSDKTKYALNRCKEKGIKIFLATGRPNNWVPKFDIEFDGVVSFNGQYCFDSNGVIYQNNINPDDVLQCKKNCDQLQIPLAIATQDKLCANYFQDTLDYYFTFASQVLEIDENYEQTIHEPVFQMMAAIDEKDDAKIIEGCKSIQITRWWDHACDIIPVNGGKEIGIQHVLDHYGFSIEESMAFGDGGNDATMIDFVGCGIAMGNAKQELKDIADYVTCNVEDDGIYEALKHFEII